MRSLPFWSQVILKDPINSEIWSESPAVQDRIRSHHSTHRADVLQALIRPGLRWVPDIVGEEWRDAGSVFIVGSAYSPFISGYAGRSRSMSLESYPRAEGAVDIFLAEFLGNVVEEDEDYYGPIRLLLEGAGLTSSQAVLTDLVRACFVRTSDLAGGDKKAVRADPDLFMAFAESGWAWTWRRLCESEAGCIVALGTVAEHGLLKLLSSEGLAVTVRGDPRGVFRRNPRPVTGYALLGRGLAFWRDRTTWWDVAGQVGGRERRWRLLPACHPNWYHGHDPGYRRTSAVLHEMLVLGGTSGG